MPPVVKKKKSHKHKAAGKRRPKGCVSRTTDAASSAAFLPTSLTQDLQREVDRLTRLDPEKRAQVLRYLITLFLDETRPQSPQKALTTRADLRLLEIPWRQLALHTVNRLRERRSGSAPASLGVESVPPQR